MMYIKVLNVYLKSDAAQGTHVNLKRNIYNQKAASSKQEQQSRRRRLQWRHNNSSINIGVVTIGTIDIPPLYSVILDALVSTLKRRGFVIFSLFLLVIGSISFRTQAADRFPALVESKKGSFLSNRTILDSTKNRGTGDSPTRCFWTQLLWFSCLDPSVVFYLLFLHILWEEKSVGQLPELVAF